MNVMISINTLLCIKSNPQLRQQQPTKLQSLNLAIVSAKASLTPTATTSDPAQESLIKSSFGSFANAIQELAVDYYYAFPYLSTVPNLQRDVYNQINYLNTNFNVSLRLHLPSYPNFWYCHVQISRPGMRRQCIDWKNQSLIQEMTNIELRHFRTRSCRRSKVSNLRQKQRRIRDRPDRQNVATLCLSSHRSFRIVFSSAEHADDLTC